MLMRLNLVGVLPFMPDYNARFDPRPTDSVEWLGRCVAYTRAGTCRLRCLMRAPRGQRHCKMHLRHPPLSDYGFAPAPPARPPFDF